MFSVFFSQFQTFCVIYDREAMYVYFYIHAMYIIAPYFNDILVRINPMI